MKLGKFFVTEKRANGDDTYVTLTSDHPDWLKDAVYEAHNGALPSDWVYAECRAACDAIDDGSLTDEDTIHEYADGRVDVYNSARWVWASAMHGTAIFSDAEEEAEELGLAECSDTTERLGVIQYCAIRRIAEVMLTAWRDHEDDEEATEEGAEEVTV